MKINFPITITAADTNKRTISGTIVSWNEQGITSAGATVFAKDSIDFSKPVKLLLEHDKTRPLGKIVDVTANERGLEATFRLAKTFAADDALEEAATGLRDGFSVGVMVDAWDNKDGAMVISKSSLHEVSLVSDPAIASAKVESVVATNTQTENSEATAEDTTTQEDKVSDTTSDAPIATEAVEAAKSEPVAIQATQPVAYTKPRSPIINKASYLEHSVRAALGNDDSKMYVRAADDTTGNNAGLIPTRQLTEIINPLSNADRPAVDSVSRGVLPDAGMSFEIPKITAVPVVQEENEADAIIETGLTNSFISIPVVKLAGGQTFSVELLDRSSPAFFDELVRQMEYAYIKAAEQQVLAALVGGTDGGNRTLDAAGLLDFVSDASVSIYKNTLGTATNILVTPEQFGAIMNLADNGRPIYQNLIGNSNQGGNLTGTSLGGNLLGLNLRVSRNLATASATGDNSLIMVNPDSFTWYESARTRLQTNVALNGQIEVVYYGYGACATKVAAGAYRFMVA